MISRHNFTNTDNQIVELAVEPWAETAYLEPGATLKFTLEGDNAVFQDLSDENGAMVFVWADRVSCGEGDLAKEWSLWGEYLGKPPPEGFSTICSVAFHPSTD